MKKLNNQSKAFIVQIVAIPGCKRQCFQIRHPSIPVQNVLSVTSHFAMGDYTLLRVANTSPSIVVNLALPHEPIVVAVSSGRRTPFPRRQFHWVANCIHRSSQELNVPRYLKTFQFCDFQLAQCAFKHFHILRDASNPQRA